MMDLDLWVYPMTMHPASNIPPPTYAERAMSHGLKMQGFASYSIYVGYENGRGKFALCT